MGTSDKTPPERGLAWFNLVWMSPSSLQCQCLFPVQHSSNYTGSRSYFCSFLSLKCIFPVLLLVLLPPLFAFLAFRTLGFAFVCHLYVNTGVQPPPPTWHWNSRIRTNKRRIGALLSPNHHKFIQACFDLNSFILFYYCTSAVPIGNMYSYRKVGG